MRESVTSSYRYKNSNSICSTVFDDLKYGGFNTSEVIPFDSLSRVGVDEMVDTLNLLPLSH